MKNFKQLRIWQNGFKIALQAYRLVEGFPKAERFGISSQITSAALSIPSNIAEGNSRSSDKDKARFIQVALGSSFELETQLLIAAELNYGSHELSAILLKDIEMENIMLHSFLSKLKTRS